MPIPEFENDQTKLLQFPCINVVILLECIEKILHRKYLLAKNHPVFASIVFFINLIVYVTKNFFVNTANTYTGKIFFF